MGSICSSIGLCCSGCLHCTMWSTRREVKKGNKHLEELRKELKKVSMESQLTREEIRQHRRPPSADGPSGGGGGTTIVVVRDEAQLHTLRLRLLAQKKHIRFLQTTIAAVEQTKMDHELKLMAPKIDAANQFVAKSNIRHTETYRALHQGLSRTAVATEMRRSEQHDMDQTLDELQGSSTQESAALLRDDPDLEGFAPTTDDLDEADKDTPMRQAFLHSMPSVPKTSANHRKELLEPEDLELA